MLLDGRFFFSLSLSLSQGRYRTVQLPRLGKFVPPHKVVSWDGRNGTNTTREEEKKQRTEPRTYMCVAGFNPCTVPSRWPNGHHTRIARCGGTGPPSAEPDPDRTPFAE